MFGKWAVWRSSRCLLATCINFRISALNHCLSALNKFVDMYEDLPASLEIFAPVKEHLQRYVTKCQFKYQKFFNQRFTHDFLFSLTFNEWFCNWFRLESWIPEKVLKFVNHFSRSGKCVKIEIKSGESAAIFFQSYNKCFIIREFLPVVESCPQPRHSIIEW